VDNPNAVPGNPESNEPVKQETAADVTEKLIALEAEAVQLSKTLAAFHDKLVENGIGTSVVAEAAFTLYITDGSSVGLQTAVCSNRRRSFKPKVAIPMAMTPSAKVGRLKDCQIP